MLIPLTGLTVLLYVAHRHPGLLRFDRRGVLPCLAWSVTACLLTGLPAMFSGAPRLEGLPILVAAPVWVFALAGLEDALFVLPAFLVPKPYRWGFLAYSSVVFTVGHAYQGNAMWGKMLSVPVVYWLAGRYGIVTTMVAHSLQDIGVIALIHAVLPFIK